MAEPILATDDLTVLGGPAAVNVEVDYGPKGDRGSRIWAILGKPGYPGVAMPPEGTNVGDIAINTLTSDSEYLFQYQKLHSGWVKLFKLIPNIYSVNQTVNFTNGVSDPILVSISDIVPSTMVATMTSENFNIQYSILNSNPMATSVSVSNITESYNLPITLRATEYNGTSWDGLNSTYTVHLFISTVV